MRFRSNWNVEVLVFEERVRKPEYLEKPLGEDNHQQTQPHMAFQPGSNWWEASMALTTAPTLAHLISKVLHGI